MVSQWHDDKERKYVLTSMRSKLQGGTGGGVYTSFITLSYGCFWSRETTCIFSWIYNHNTGIIVI